MGAVRAGRFSADMEGDFVVLLIGRRFTKPWPVFGLAAASRHVPVGQRGQSAAGRIGLPDEPAVEPY